MKFFPKYNDSIQFLFRTGKEDDPLKDCNETHTVTHEYIQLQEIPDENYKVRIDNYIEITQYEYENNGYVINNNEFLVNYITSMIRFNSSQENNSVTVHYKGKGIMQTPAERICLHSPNPWLIQNLQEFVDLIIIKDKELRQAVADTIEFMTNKKNEFTTFINEKYNELNNKFDEFMDLLNKNKNEFISFMRTKTDEYEHYIDNFINKAEEKIQIITNKIQESKEATVKCIEQTNECEKQTINCLYQTEHSMLIWKPPIEDKYKAKEIFPQPELGWTTVCLDNGDVLRFDNVSWKKIGNMVGNVPLATDYINGLMSVEDKRKLNGIEAGAEKNFRGENLKKELPIETKIKDLLFVVPNEIQLGDLGILIPVPVNGKIIKIEAYCQTPSQSGSWAEFSILKTNSLNINNYNGWEELTDKFNRLKFLANYRVAVQPVLIENNVLQNDILRIICTRRGEKLSNMTIHIQIEI